MTLFSYEAGSGVLHSVDPRLKLAALLSLTITVFAVPSPAAGVSAGLIGPAALLLLGWGIEGASRTRPSLPPYRLKRIAPLLIPPVLIVVVRGAPGFDYATRFLIVAMLGDLTIAVTSRGRCIDAIAWACSRLPRQPRAMIPLAMAVALSSAPLFITVMHRAREACTVRGVRLRRHPRVAATQIARAALDDVPRRINRIGDAMVVRGFSLDPTPPVFAPGRGDSILVILVILTIGISLVASRWAIFFP